MATTFSEMKLTVDYPRPLLVKLKLYDPDYSFGPFLANATLEISKSMAWIKLLYCPP